MKIKRKLKSKAGLSLAETLLAVLILIFVGMMLTNGTSVVQKIYNDVIMGANAHMLLSTATTALRNELDTARDVQVLEDKKTIVYLDSSINALSMISVNSDDPDKPKGILVTPFIKKKVSNPGAVVSYEEIKLNDADPSRAYQIVSNVKANASSNENLYITYTGAAYTEPDLVTFTKLEVYRDSDKTNPLTTLETLQIRIITESGVE